MEITHATLLWISAEIYGDHDDEDVSAWQATRPTRGFEQSAKRIELSGTVNSEGDRSLFCSQIHFRHLQKPGIYEQKRKQPMVR